MSEPPSRSIVEQAVGDTYSHLYEALLRQSKVEADAFFAGAVLACLTLNDPLLHDATLAVLLTSDDQNPRAFEILSEIHQRIQRLREEPSGPESPSVDPC